MARRTLSTKGKIITGIIYALAVILLVTVIIMNQQPGTVEAPTETATTAASVTNELPYNAEGSDKYVDIIPAYKVSQVSLKQEGSELVAYVDGKKAENYVGVCTDGTKWFFVRNGAFDKNYNGIAGNELGNWYVKNGVVDFTFSGNYIVNNLTYNIKEGKVVE